MDWIELVSPEQLQSINKESQEFPVLIFKHSTTCSISAMARHRLERKSSKVPGLRAYFLDLRAYRDVSKLVEATFGVEHESPQVLIIDKGQAVYHRSHGEIDPADIREVLAARPIKSS